MNLFKFLTCKDNDELLKLQQENKVLKDKLAERQEVINKTNAYWKKKLSALSKSKR